MPLSGTAAWTASRGRAVRYGPFRAPRPRAPGAQPRGRRPEAARRRPGAGISSVPRCVPWAECTCGGKAPVRRRTAPTGKNARNGVPGWPPRHAPGDGAPRGGRPRHSGGDLLLRRLGVASADPQVGVLTARSGDAAGVGLTPGARGGGRGLPPGCRRRASGTRCSRHHGGGRDDGEDRAPARTRPALRMRGERASTCVRTGPRCPPRAPTSDLPFAAGAGPEWNCVQGTVVFGTPGGKDAP